MSRYAVQVRLACDARDWTRAILLIGERVQYMLADRRRRIREMHVRYHARSRARARRKRR